MMMDLSHPVEIILSNKTFLGDENLSPSHILQTMNIWMLKRSVLNLFTIVYSTY